MKTIIALTVALSITGCANMSYEEQQIMGANLVNLGTAMIQASQPRGPDMTCYHNGSGQYSCYR